MAYTFFKADGFTVGKSLVEDDMMPTALEVKSMADKPESSFYSRPIIRLLIPMTR